MARRSPRKCSRYVDMWAMPGIHPSNVEFLQQLKTADTQHFTKNMNTVGTVSEKDEDSGKWQKTHLIGVRTDVWKPDKEENGAYARSVAGESERRTAPQYQENRTI